VEQRRGEARRSGTRGKLDITERLFKPRETGTKIEDYLDVDERARALGLAVPTSLCFLPRNFDDAAAPSELIHESSVSTLRILFRRSEITESCLEPQGTRLPLIQENGFELILPSLFVATALLADNPQIVNIALGVIANYATDFFKGIPGTKTVRFSIVTKDAAGRSKRIKYCGDPAGIKELTKLVGKLNDDKR
jgi:hypothetical protein